MIATSMVLVGQKKSAGWLLYVMASAGWVCVGIKLELSSMVLWSLVFGLVGVMSWRRWKKSP